MPDLRVTVETNRDLIKKIQLVIPGYRGYRLREDLRDADRLLRVQLADYLQMKVQQPLDQTLDRLSSALELRYIDDVSSVRYAIKKLEAKIRHAEQGYSGISPPVNIGEGELNRLYEFDEKLVDGIKALHSRAGVLVQEVDNKQYSSMQGILREISRQVQALDECMKKRSVLHSDIFAQKGKGG